MDNGLNLWRLLFIVSNYGLVLRADPIPSSDTTSVLEVSAGETAKLTCPSNDKDHRFQFWQLTDNNILGPGNRINERKYKYEVLSGTLFIKAVSHEEHGIYTCVCRHLLNSTFNAKSVLLLVKSEWQKHWEDDEVNFYRMIAIVLVVIILCVAAYIIRNNMKYDRLRRFRDLTNESADEDSRKGSYDLPPLSRNAQLGDGLDNPALDTDLQFTGESTSAFQYPRNSNYTSFK